MAAAICLAAANLSSPPAALRANGGFITMTVGWIPNWPTFAPSWVVTEANEKSRRRISARVSSISLRWSALPSPAHAASMPVPALGSRTTSSAEMDAMRATSHDNASGVEKCWCAI